MSFNASSVDRFHTSLKAHLVTFFVDHTLQYLPSTSGKLRAVVPSFQIISVAPGSRLNLWCYVSSGTAIIPDRSNQRMEFVLFAPEAHPRHAEILTRLTYYHSLPNARLALGDTVPLGEPWLEDSICDHLLLSPLYPLPRAFAGYQVDDQHIHLVWALPITKAERDFKVANGRDALEQRFQAARLPYWQPNRKSVIDAE